MSRAHRISPWISILLIVAAEALIGWSAAVRVRHCDEVTSFAGGSELAVDPGSPTGYAGGLRPLVVPVRDPRSLQWVVQAQELAARGIWRLERVSYDNAPTGREVWSPSPYRWWLVLAGRVDAMLTGRPVAAGIERAALWADPVLHGLLVLAAAGLVWRGVGASAAAGCALLLATVFPLGLTFLPGRPDEQGLGLLCMVLAVLPLVIALTCAERRHGRWWFLLAGVAGGLGLWVNINQQLPVLAGILLGGGVSAWWRKSTTGAAASEAPSPAWRAWAIAGAVITLVGWLAEHMPDRLSLAGARWDLVHPAFALVWLGCGELLARLEVWARRGRAAWSPGAIAAALVAVVAIAGPLVLAVRAASGEVFGLGEVLARMHDLAAEMATGGVWAWIAGRGFSMETIAALATVLIGVAVLGWALWHPAVGRRAKGGVIFVAGVALAALIGASFRPGDWASAAVVLALLSVPIGLVVHESAAGWRLRVGAAVAAVLSLGLGVAASFPSGVAGVSRAEVLALIERDLAWWLAAQSPESGAIVLAPPDLTSALVYHGGLRGLGSPFRENEEGFRFSVRLSAASTPDEGQALVESRGVRYVVMPSWDGFLDQYARLGANQPDKTLIALLHQWQPPRWLRAIPYQMPRVEGFAGESVYVFQVVDLQDNPTALGRLAEFFLETGQIAPARRLASALKEVYPTEPAAFIARAHVAIALRDAGGFREIVETILPMLEDGSAETLTWDRRVSLALMLAQARQTDAARLEVQRCVDEMDEIALRSLTNLSLQRYLAMLKSFGLEITDPELRALATRLLPQEMRTP